MEPTLLSIYLESSLEFMVLFNLPFSAVTAVINGSDNQIDDKEYYKESYDLQETREKR